MEGNENETLCLLLCRGINYTSSSEEAVFNFFLSSFHFSVQYPRRDLDDSPSSIRLEMNLSIPFAACPFPLHFFVLLPPTLLIRRGSLHFSRESVKKRGLLCRCVEGLAGPCRATWVHGVACQAPAGTCVCHPLSATTEGGLPCPSAPEHVQAPHPKSPSPRWVSTTGFEGPETSYSQKKSRPFDAGQIHLQKEDTRKRRNSPYHSMISQSLFIFKYIYSSFLFTKYTIY